MFDKKHLTAFGFGLGLITMVVQFFFTLVERAGIGENAGEATVYFFGYLTNLSNIWIVLIYAALLFDAKWLRVFDSVRMRASALALIILVSLFYHFVLRPTFTPVIGLELYLDWSKHYLVGAFYVMWWVFVCTRGPLRVRDLPVMALPGAFYIIYVFARGALINAYPYAAIDVSEVGYSSALAYAVQVIVGFAILCALVVFIDKTLSRTKTRPSK